MFSELISVVFVFEQKQFILKHEGFSKKKKKYCSYSFKHEKVCELLLEIDFNLFLDDSHFFLAWVVPYNKLMNIFDFFSVCIP